MASAEQQILEEQRVVDYDVKEYIVEILVNQLESEELFIPPYQRKFVWPIKKQCRFIESLILGLPIPFLFCADTEDGRIEVVDGSQRLQTLRKFLSNGLRLSGLEKLDRVNRFRFKDLPIAQQRKLRNRSLRMIVLSEKADSAVRFDVFERINSGSVDLTPAEFRRGAFQGPFYQLILRSAENPLFRELCPIGKAKEKRDEHAELALRFYAYADSYLDFTHDVAAFLNRYVSLHLNDDDIEEREAAFLRMLSFVNQHFPIGFRKAANINDTPRVRFEALSIGTHLALELEPNLTNPDLSWLTSQEFKTRTTTHASNSGPRLRGRIEFVRDALLGR